VNQEKYQGKKKIPKPGLLSLCPLLTADEHFRVYLGLSSTALNTRAKSSRHGNMEQAGSSSIDSARKQLPQQTALRVPLTFPCHFGQHNPGLF
jgi:hypothetical protein